MFYRLCLCPQSCFSLSAWARGQYQVVRLNGIMKLPITDHDFETWKGENMIVQEKLAVSPGVGGRAKHISWHLIIKIFSGPPLPFPRLQPKRKYDIKVSQQVQQEGFASSVHNCRAFRACILKMLILKSNMVLSASSAELWKAHSPHMLCIILFL